MYRKTRRNLDPHGLKLLNFAWEEGSDEKLLKDLINEFPEMITEDRTNTVYDGQTILHMAVTKRKKRVVKTLLEADKVQQHKQKLLQGLATGDIFMNTVTMAQLPLSIAAVTGRRGIFDLLQQHKAELDATNTYGDNVCHSLIR